MRKIIKCLREAEWVISLLDWLGRIGWLNTTIALISGVAMMIWARIGDLPAPVIVTLGLVLFATVLVIFWVATSLAQRSKKPSSAEGLSPRELDKQIGPQIIDPQETYFSKKRIRLADLIFEGSLHVESKTFEDCYIYGPAMVSLQSDARLDHCTLNGDPGAIFTIIEPGQTVQGIILIDGCVFRRCTFLYIGFLGTEAQVNAARNNFGADA